MSAFPYDLDWEIERQLSIEAKIEKLEVEKAELLEALKWIEHRVSYEDRLAIRAVIAKAEGKE